MILDMIQEWFKELLIDGIISNLTGMFDTLNTKVGEIAGEVGMTPAAWNSSIFNMIHNLLYITLNKLRSWQFRMIILICLNANIFYIISQFNIKSLL